MTSFSPAQVSAVSHIIGFGLVGLVFSLIITIPIYKLLSHFKIWRKDVYDPTLGIEGRKGKASTPIMGGLIVVLTITIITYFFNWDRQFTWVPIGAMLISSVLGAFDDLLSVMAKKRRARSLRQTITLIKVHKNIFVRFWYVITLPWSVFKEIGNAFGSKRGIGVHAYEKLLLQFIAGGVTAWWIYFKLGETWKEIHIPFDGFLNIGIWIIPVIILIVIFTANAVNISDGMDGLAGGMLIPTFSALTFLSAIFGYQELAILNAVTTGALVTYTFFNVKPAKFQMGDVGSLALGTLLAINALAINIMMVLPFIAFMFYVEAVSVIIQVIGRLFFGRRIFKMAPLHHHFELLGWSEEKTIMRFWVIHLAMVLIGVWIGLH
ncbi:MAG TPA: phospho-N-acetylmuramoyl-pentapeptide-transferase [Candidatus Paceibacterota bacterium]|nr:phospho-N-acetylmuramoyl-pentapeptide-transferase [Candidatus Paceibacterota bacterium]